MGRFSDYNVDGDAVEVQDLLAACTQLRDDLINGTEVPGEDVDDICACLKSEAFYELVKPFFPFLRGEQDPRIVEDSLVIVKMVEAANDHLPEPYQDPQAEQYSLVLARHFYSVMTSFIFKEKIDKQMAVKLAIAFEGLFEAVDGTIPGMLDELLNADGTFKLGAYRRPPPRKGGAARTGPAGGNFYQGAGPQGRDTQTQTGVINGGNTCYQNVTIRLIMSSHPVLERLLELREGEFPEGGIGLPRPLFDLISAIQARHFVESKTLLKLVWDLLGNKDRAWGPGNQQDMEEFLTSWVIPEMEGVFASWEHKTIDEDRCQDCSETTQSEPTPTFSSSLAIPNTKEGPTSLKRVFNDWLTGAQYIEKTCQPCGGNTDHCRFTNLQPADENKLPELVLSVKRFHEVGRKVRSKIELNPGLFASLGLNALYFIEYIAIHVGDSLQYGHYYSYERASPAREQGRTKPSSLIDREAREAAGELADAPTAADYQEEEAYAATSFAKWTRYEDEKKELNRPFSDISQHDRDWYICRLVPATPEDVQAYLQTSVPKHTTNAALEAIRAALEKRLSLIRALRPDGDLIKTGTEVLRCVFNIIGNALGDDLENIGSQPHEDTETARRFRLDARTALNDSPPPSPDEDAEDDGLLEILNDLLTDVWARSRKDSRSIEENAQEIYNALFDRENVVVKLIEAACRATQTQLHRLRDDARRQFTENLPAFREEARQKEDAARKAAEARQAIEAQRAAAAEAKRLAEEMRLTEERQGAEERRAAEEERARQLEAEKLAKETAAKKGKGGSSGTGRRAGTDHDDLQMQRGIMESLGALAGGADLQKALASLQPGAGTGTSTTSSDDDVTMSGTGSSSGPQGASRQDRRSAGSTNVTVLEPGVQAAAAAGMEYMRQSEEGGQQSEPPSTPSHTRSTTIPHRPSPRRGLADPGTHDPRPSPPARTGEQDPFQAAGRGTTSSRPARPRTSLSSTGSRRSARVRDRTSGRYDGPAEGPIPPHDGPADPSVSFDGSAGAELSDLPSAQPSATPDDGPSTEASEAPAEERVTLKRAFSQNPAKTLKSMRSRKKESKARAEDVFSQPQESADYPTRKGSKFFGQGAEVSRKKSGFLGLGKKADPSQATDSTPAEAEAARAPEPKKRSGSLDMLAKFLGGTGAGRERQAPSSGGETGSESPAPGAPTKAASSDAHSDSSTKTVVKDDTVTETRALTITPVPQEAEPAAESDTQEVESTPKSTKHACSTDRSKEK